MAGELRQSDNPRFATHGDDRLITQCARRHRFAIYQLVVEIHFGVLYLFGLLTDGSMSNACVQGISVGIYVFGNEFVSQTKVDFHCAPWMVEFKSDDIDTLHVITGTHVMGTTAFGGGGFAVCGTFLLIVS